MGRNKYLTGMQVLSSPKDYRWLNWYVSRGRFAMPTNQDAILRKDMRMVSWRRA